MIEYFYRKVVHSESGSNQSSVSTARLKNVHEVGEEKKQTHKSNNIPEKTNPGFCMYVKVGMKSNSEEITLSVLYLSTFDYCSIRHAIKASYS